MAMKTSLRALAVTAVLAACTAWAQLPGWQADPDVVRQTTERQPQFTFDEAGVPPYQLPDPLAGGLGTVTTAQQWPSRRAEILELFRAHVYGRVPGRPDALRFETLEEQAQALDGAATLRRVAVVSRHDGREHRFTLTMFLPNASGEPVGLFLLLNNRPTSNTDPTRTETSGFWPAEAVIARGYAIAALQNNELAPDDAARFREGIIGLFEGTTAGPRPESAWGALAAWGWGASRAMDYFESDPRIDASRVAVLGHSRGGKAALWAGAEDQRFALTISNNSGQGGAALSRRRFGETVARITTSFPHWFAPAYASYGEREDALPVDQHMLLALMAPRAVYVASASDDLWADPRGEYLALAHASPVYALWGDPPLDPAGMPPLDRPVIAGRRGYHVRTGGHNLTPYDWERYMDFADAYWRR
jgi:hypothetical protein